MWLRTPSTLVLTLVFGLHGSSCAVVENVSDSTFEEEESALLQLQSSLQAGYLEVRDGLLANRSTNVASLQPTATTANRLTERLLEKLQVVGHDQYAVFIRTYAQPSAWILLMAGATYIFVKEAISLRTDDVTAETKRDPHLDNAKFFALTLMVLNHLSHHLDLPFARPYTKFSFFIMPLFVILNGAVASAPPTKDRLVNFAVSTVAPLALACLVLFPMAGAIVSVADGAKVGAALSNMELLHTNPFALVFSATPTKLANVYGVVKPIPSEMYAPIWYLRCFVLWRILSWMMYAIPSYLQLMLSLFAGTVVVMHEGTFFAPEAGNEPSILTRTITMSPFFFAGKCIDWRLLASVVPEPSRRWMAASWIVFLIFIGFYEAYEGAADSFVFAVETYWEPFSRCCDNRDQLKNPAPFTHYCWARYWGDLLFRAAQGVLFMLFCVPRGHFRFSIRGMRSMYPYLLHMIPLALLHKPSHHSAFWATLDPNSTWAAMGVSAIMQLLCYLVCIVLTFVLASDACRDLFGWALEPTWLMDVGKWGARLVDGSHGTQEQSSDSIGGKEALNAKETGRRQT